MHEENKTTCACDDNAEETHNDLSWLIQFAIYELECNSQTFKMIQEDRVFLEKRKLKQLQKREVL